MLGGNRLVAQADGSIQNDLRPECIPAGAGRTAYHALQALSLIVVQYRRLCLHTGHHTPYGYYCN